MANDEAYRRAEEKIEEALRSGATELDLSCSWKAEDSEKLTKVPESVGQLTQLQTLDLSNNQLTALPESLGQLTQLQTLNVVGNQLTALPESLGQLTQLHTLYLRHNQLTALPESLGQLTQLQTLDLDTNQLSALPEWLGQLTRLQTLNLGGNQLTVLPEWLGQLTQLQTLYLSDNELTALPESLSHLKQLQVLDLADNQLTAMPEFLGQFRQLETLFIGGNALTSLPDCLGQLPLMTLVFHGMTDTQVLAIAESLGKLSGLRRLEISNGQVTKLTDSIAQLTSLTELAVQANKLKALPRSFETLTGLETLSVGGNSLREFPFIIRNFSQLKTLHLWDNKLESVPDWVCELEALATLNLDGNPLIPELDAAYKQGFDAFKSYLRARAEEQIVLNEAKLILIGEGEVGKSSLLGALRGDEWVEERPTTHGVEVDIKTVVFTDPESATEITFNGWDFGGQNIYRHTHQLFFTAPAIYLAVWNPRRGPEQCCVDEWIKMVRQRAFDEDCPEERPRILVVATHGGPKERSAHIDEQLLRDEFGDLIAGFHHVDSKTGHGLEELKEAIAREAAAIPSVGRSVPKSWKNMLDALRKRSKKDPYLSYKQFRGVCRRQKVTNELADTYAGILNELGHLIHYRDDEVLQDTVVLNAEYISKAISYVLEDDVAKDQNGLVEHNRLSGIWNDPSRDKRERFPPELHRIFLRLMDRFDLSYQVAMPNKDDPETSLVAQLVPGGRPENWEEDWTKQPEQGDAERRRICRLVDSETGRPTEVEGLLYRLIVRLHRYSMGRQNYFDSRHWKTGMILDDGFNGRAFIEDIAGDVHVTVRAAYPDGFLGSLCNEIRSLVDQFWKGLDCRLSVPCHAPCKGLHELEELVATKREGIPKIRCSVCKSFFEIDSLLVAATAKLPISVVLTELKKVRSTLADMKKAQDELGSDVKQMIGQANEQFELFMNALTDPAKDGPRLFSFEPIEPGFWDKPKWIAEKFRLTLWCEHSRVPLPELTGDTECGVYEVELTREWVKKSAPYLKVLSTTLSLALPVASAGMKLAMDEAAYKAVEDQLSFGRNCAESFLKGSEKIGDWITSDDESQLNPGGELRRYGAELRGLHAILKGQDPGNRYGDLVRVQNKRRNYLWVHEQFVGEY